MEHARRDDGYRYELVVEQQPVRARMCGFGDKDRRPITPPPCIRLVVRNSKGQKIDVNDLDGTSFVLMVDLWHEDSSRAVNLVRHSSSAPTISISSSTVTSYPPLRESPVYMTPAMVSQYNGYDMPVPMPPRPVMPYGQPPLPSDYYGSAQAPPSYPPYASPSGYGQSQVAMPVVAAPSSNHNHTRNLIGMNAVNACRLNDPEGKPGFWFILQDLSVRTEGTFRLKISMCDIGTRGGAPAAIGQKFPILATNFSAPFTVYSAKKFPGVIESTPLSKCFAQQGIKIPIRKDGPKNLSNQSEYDADVL